MAGPGAFRTVVNGRYQVTYLMSALQLRTQPVALTSWSPQSGRDDRCGVCTEFNGDHSNYDGSGRSAHDNNTVYLFLWLAV